MKYLSADFNLIILKATEGQSLETQTNFWANVLPHFFCCASLGAQVLFLSCYVQRYILQGGTGSCCCHLPCVCVLTCLQDSWPETAMKRLEPATFRSVF